jgi:hypothetical protein
MERTKWTERKFTFDFPEGWMPNILERLAGTQARLYEMTRNISAAQAALKAGNKWSMKENIGHLTDLEDLHEGRIDDFRERKTTLRAADMSNKKTVEAGHNAKSVDQLINEFGVRREQFIKRLLLLDDATQQFKSLHPRLQIMMRPVDVAYFTAEHDDHHLADIRVILNSLKK